MEGGLKKKIGEERGKKRNLTVIRSSVNMWGEALVLAAREMVALENGLLPQHRTSSQLHHQLWLFGHRHLSFILSNPHPLISFNTQKDEESQTENNNSPVPQSTQMQKFASPKKPQDSQKPRNRQNGAR